MKRFLTSVVCLLLTVFLVLSSVGSVFAEASSGNDEVRNVKKDNTSGGNNKMKVDLMPLVVYAESEDEFLGSWKFNRTEYKGVIVEPEEMVGLGLPSMEVSMDIHPGAARIDVKIDGTADFALFTTTYADGRLQLRGVTNNSALTLMMTETGECYFENDMTGVPQKYYFAKAGADPESADDSSSGTTGNGADPAEGGLHLEAGEYVGGVSIPAGKYILSCEAGPKDYGIVSLAADTDNLAEEFPSLLYEFIDFNTKRYYFIHMKHGYILSLPFACDLTLTDRIELNNGTARLPAGKYTFGEELPAGKYMVVCETGENEYGTIWGQTDTDDKTESFGSMPSIFVGSNQTKRYYINAKNDYVICNSLTCTINETESLAFEGDSITIPAGRYEFGDDLPSGKYILSCDTTGQDSGLIMLSKENGQMTLLEYIEENVQKEYSIDAQDGYALETSFECTLTKPRESDSK